MFYSTAIPGILQAQQAQPVAMTPGVIDKRERQSASMTVEQPAEPQGTNVSDTTLTLSTLYEQFRRPIHSYIYRLLGNFEDADDVTQEVFVRAFTSWNGLYEREHLSPWLYRIATNLCVDMLRRRKRISWRSLSQRYHQDDEISEDTARFLSDSGGIPEIAERELIRLALANMPAEYAVVLVLSAAQGVPYQEIATIVGTSPNAAATRISRAKRMFLVQYQRLSKDGVAKQEKQG